MFTYMYLAVQQAIGGEREPLAIHKVPTLRLAPLHHQLTLVGLQLVTVFLQHQHISLLTQIVLQGFPLQVDL